MCYLFETCSNMPGFIRKLLSNKVFVSSTTGYLLWYKFKPKETNKKIEGSCIFIPKWKDDIYITLSSVVTLHFKVYHKGGMISKLSLKDYTLGSGVVAKNFVYSIHLSTSTGNIVISLNQPFPLINKYPYIMFANLDPEEYMESESYSDSSFDDSLIHTNLDRKRNVYVTQSESLNIDDFVSLTAYRDYILDDVFYYDIESMYVSSDSEYDLVC